MAFSLPLLYGGCRPERLLRIDRLLLLGLVEMGRATVARASLGV